jgi:RNA polymerase sigma factor (sigma-70 family)
MWFILKFLQTLFGRIGRKELYALADEELVMRYLESQDDFLFSILYDRYAQKIYAKCMTMLRNLEAAQDSTHDIFIKVLLNLARYNGRAKFSTWLYSITYNHCIDLIRKGGNKMRSELPIDQVEQEDHEISDAFLMEIKMNRLKLVLDQMDDHDRSTLIMKYQDDLTIKEMAEILAIEESATKMRIQRAKWRFKWIYDQRFSRADD